MGREHRQGLVGVQEQGEDEVERRVRLARAGHAPLVAVAQRRLVPVVAVGDVDGTGVADLGQARDGAVRAVVGEHPQPMVDAVVVNHVGDGWRRRHGGELGRGRARRVAVEHDDRRGVHPGRSQEPVAVLARSGQRALVGQHAAVGSERLEAQASEVAALRPLDPVPGTR